MSTTMRDQILGYSNIEKFFTENTSAVHPYSIKDVAFMLGDQVTGELQVKGYVTKHYLRGNLSRIREGKNFKYWWKENGGQQTQEPPNLEALENLTFPEDELAPANPDIPEITVNSRDKFVTIKTPTVKITIEY
jgi:hypothetical protein